MYRSYAMNFLDVKKNKKIIQILNFIYNDTWVRYSLASSQMEFFL